MRLSPGKAAFALIWVWWYLSATSAGAASFYFANSTNIAINSLGVPYAAAAPYPSTITVTGLTGLMLSKVTVTLSNFSHSYPSDVEVLLVGPHGQEGLLMAAVAGPTGLNYPATNVTLTLDDAAASYLPITNGLVSGTFKPTNGYLLYPSGYTNLAQDFLPPAPSGSSNAVPSLSMFNNTDPNGTWSLFVMDQGEGDTGSISNGWSLKINAAVPLSVSHNQTNVIVSWTNAVTGCTLQSTPKLSTSWTNVPAPVVMSSGRFWVTNPATASSSFYRLVK